MCLLFTRKAGVSEQLSDEWLRDFHSRNQDGYGVMYADDGVLYTEKGIGSPEDWIAFYRKHEHRTAAFHLRMKTHGWIDLENCHPYVVYGDGADMPVSMMHNGILHTGNTRDVSKSDTWHFIRDYLIPLTKSDPALIFSPEMERVLGKFIGNNRFAMMNHDGLLAVVNREQGLEWKGMWLSNTYAWSHFKAFPPKALPRYAPNYDTSSWRKEWEAAGGKAIKQPTKKVVKTGGKPAVVNSKANDHYDDCVVAFDDLEVRSKEVARVVSLPQMERLFQEFGAHDAWRWIEAFAYSTGKEAETKFVSGMQDTRKVKDWLNAVDRTTVTSLDEFVL